MERCLSLSNLNIKIVIVQRINAVLIEKILDLKCESDIIHSQTRSVVKNYKAQDLSCQGSTRRVDLQALDSNIVIYFIQGCVKRLFHHAPRVCRNINPHDFDMGKIG